MVGQGWLLRTLRRAATAAIRDEFPRELASTQSPQPAPTSCSTLVSNSHSQEPLVWTVVHRARGPWGCRAQRRVDRAVVVLSRTAEKGRFWSSATLSTACWRLALYVTAWKSRSLTCLGNPSGSCVLFLSHVASVGRP